MRPLEVMHLPHFEGLLVFSLFKHIESPRLAIPILTIIGFPIGTWYILFAKIY